MIKKIVFYCLLMAMPTVNALSQQVCSPIGWASYDGTTTGGGAVSPQEVKNSTEFIAAVQSADAKVIYFAGTINTGTTIIPIASNKTIIGLSGAVLQGCFSIMGTNVVIRNIVFQGNGAPGVENACLIRIKGGTRIWIDHCDFRDGEDGELYITNSADYITVTWCKFSFTSLSTASQFSSLIGFSNNATDDANHLKVTFQYNWWADGCIERMPRVRFGQVHVVNNLYTSSTAIYCIRADIQANIMIEGNAFINTKNPLDIYDNTCTVTFRNNYVATSTSGSQTGNGTSFIPPYTLAITPALELQALVGNPTTGAGATLANPLSCYPTTAIQHSNVVTDNFIYGADKIEIKNIDVDHIIVYSVSGEVILSIANKSEISFDTLAKGIYLFKVMDTLGKVYTGKFMVG